MLSTSSPARLRTTDGRMTFRSVEGERFHLPADIRPQADLIMVNLEHFVRQFTDR